MEALLPELRKFTVGDLKTIIEQIEREGLTGQDESIIGLPVIIQVVNYWASDTSTRFVYKGCKRTTERGEIKCTTSNEKKIRAMLRLQQGKLCPVCGLELPQQRRGEKAMPLDHHHISGLIRAVLHPRCNTLEGTVGMRIASSLGLKWRDYTHRSHVMQTMVELLPELRKL